MVTIKEQHNPGSFSVIRVICRGVFFRLKTFFFLSFRCLSIYHVYISFVFYAVWFYTRKKNYFILFKIKLLRLFSRWKIRKNLLQWNFNHNRDEELLLKYTSNKRKAGDMERDIYIIRVVSHYYLARSIGVMHILYIISCSKTFITVKKMSEI
jgi:hypothetical protein